METFINFISSYESHIAVALTVLFCLNSVTFIRGFDYGKVTLTGVACLFVAQLVSLSGLLIVPVALYMGANDWAMLGAMFLTGLLPLGKVRKRLHKDRIETLRSFFVQNENIHRGTFKKMRRLVLS